MLTDFFRTRTKTKWAGIVLFSLVLVVVIFLSFFNWNSFRPALGRMITAKTGRPASIDGDLKVHLWSWNPTAEVNGLGLKNPKWADRDLMFGAKRITISVSLGRLLRGQIVLPQVELLDPIVNLERDAQGRASWELGSAAGTPNHDTEPVKVPTIRRLIIRSEERRVGKEC
jgi:AsmA family protein